MPRNHTTPVHKTRGSPMRTYDLKRSLDFAIIWATWYYIVRSIRNIPDSWIYSWKLLKKLGCSKVMFAALTSMYTVTQFLLVTTLITAVLGVRQGSPILVLSIHSIPRRAGTFRETVSPWWPRVAALIGTYIDIYLSGHNLWTRISGFAFWTWTGSLTWIWTWIELWMIIH